MHDQFARHAVRRTALWLGGIQAASVAGLLLPSGSDYTLTDAIASLAAIQFAVALVILWSTWRQLRKTTPASADAALADSKLPTVTVAIPARNEDALLEDCLVAVLASDYPKLEVIVLDDCSADRTPDIIRSFAQAGVRFVRGHEPASGWLAKNQAYDRLAAEASGSLILFCGVDVRLQRGSIRQLVAVMRQRDKSMISVLPLNTHPVKLPLLQAMRYCWEMSLPRRQFSRPPVLSSCWIVSRDLLRGTGGFAAFRRSVTPEAHFARAATASDSYSFLRSDARLGISTEKTASEQSDTALQTRYPQLHRRPELVMAVALIEAVLLLAPLAVVVYALLTLHIVSLLLSAAALITLLVAFVCLQQAIFTRVSIARLALALVPALCRDIHILHASMYGYEFGSVNWRGRNICYPVMQSTPPKV
jgi:hypothetical protein